MISLAASTEATKKQWDVSVVSATMHRWVRDDFPRRIVRWWPLWSEPSQKLGTNLTVAHRIGYEISQLVAKKISIE
jgi:hypothetical protein